MRSIIGIETIQSYLPTTSKYKDSVRSACVLSNPKVFIASPQNTKDSRNCIDANYLVLRQPRPSTNDYIVTVHRDYDCHLQQNAIDISSDIVKDSCGNKIQFSGIVHSLATGIRHHLKSLSYKEVYYNPCWKFTLEHNSKEMSDNASELQATLPAGMTLRPLMPAHADVVNQNWTFTGPGTLEYVRDLITHNLTMGAFVADTGSNDGSAEPNLSDEPVAWAVRYADGALGMAHTQPEWRRRGIMSAVLAQLAVAVLAAGQPEVYCFVIEDNQASMAMLEKLGFVRSAEQYCWMAFEPPHGHEVSSPLFLEGGQL